MYQPDFNNTSSGTNNVFNATIASGASLSDAMQLSKSKPPRGFTIAVPSAWTAADIGFEVSMDNSTWYPVEDKSSVRLRISGIATSEALAYVAPAELIGASGFNYLRLRSLTVGDVTNVNQGAARSLIVAAWA